MLKLWMYEDKEAANVILDARVKPAVHTSHRPPEDPPPVLGVMSTI